MDINKLEQGLRERAQPDFCLADYRGDAVPFTTPEKSLAGMRIALVSSGGFHLVTDPPFDTEDPLGDPTFRELPDDLQRDQWALAHTHYDHRYVLADHNCALPTDRLHEEIAEGRVGSSSPVHLSFMGYCLRADSLMETYAPLAAQRLLAANVDGVVLAPT